MDAIANTYQFLFESYQGAGVLILIVFALSLVLAALFELKIRKRYKDRGFKNPEDDWNDPEYED